MFQKNKKLNVFLSSTLALVLVAALAITAMAAGSLKTEEIDALVNTQTDKAQVSSPFIQVANEVRESVVGVNNYQRSSTRSPFYNYGFRFGDQVPGEERVLYTGSGVVISNYGHILTNYHVVDGASKLTVTFGSKEAEATLVAQDEGLDIAVLLVPGIELKPVQLGNSDEVQVGEWAIVVGNPLGQEFDRTVTVGVVSAYNREIEGQATDRYGRRGTVTNAMIQVDAAINSGNSGGGMFNTLGQLQGIPSVKLDNSRSMFAMTQIDNIGMCLPINAAKPLIREALEKYDAASVTKATVTDNSEEAEAQTVNSDPNRPRVGITVGTLPSNLRLVANNTLPQGAYISAVEKNSPAEAAGLKPGDIIVEAAGTIVSTHLELIEKLGEYKAGDKVDMKYFRAEGLAEIIKGEKPISELGDGDYYDTQVELKVLSDSL